VRAGGNGPRTSPRNSSASARGSITQELADYPPSTAPSPTPARLHVSEHRILDLVQHIAFFVHQHDYVHAVQLAPLHRAEVAAPNGYHRGQKPEHRHRFGRLALQPGGPALEYASDFKVEGGIGGLEELGHTVFSILAAVCVCHHSRSNPTRYPQSSRHPQGARPTRSHEDATLLRSRECSHPC
jgi:hypothetical protein